MQMQILHKIAKLNQTPLVTSIFRRKIHKRIQNFVANLPEDLSSYENFDALENYIEQRKSHGDTKLVQNILSKLENVKLNSEERNDLQRQLQDEIWKFPNSTHPDIKAYGEDPKCISVHNPQKEFHFEPKQFADIAKKLNLLRMEHLGNFTGHKSYYFTNDLARLEHALIKYTAGELKKKGFKLMSVPDILPEQVIQGCGMSTRGERNQVYKLAGPEKFCLSGTSEMALAGYFSESVLNECDLPIKVAAVSRCFRAETSGLQEEKGIYRVHQFTKVEMFSVCKADQSDEMLETFKDIEIDLFSNLGLHFKLLDMPPCELGAPAYRKYDIEAWMPGRKMWGEISSCSNCTDYQAKRLHIKYKENDVIKYAHTVNGTACAIPRILISLLETNQLENSSVRIPERLQYYMNGQTEIVKQKILPELKLVKKINQNL